MTSLEALRAYIEETPLISTDEAMLLGVAEDLESAYQADRMKTRELNLLVLENKALRSVLKRARPFVYAWPQCRGVETADKSAAGLVQAIDSVLLGAVHEGSTDLE
jgi:hypothetical protein